MGGKQLPQGEVDDKRTWKAYETPTHPYRSLGATTIRTSEDKRKQTRESPKELMKAGS